MSLVAPVAAPSKFGCSWTMSWPMATWTVTGTPKPDAGGQDARLGEGETAVDDGPADGLAQPDAVAASGARRLVDAAGLPPEAELAGADVAGDALRGPADEGQLIIVDGPGAVEGDVA